MGLLDPLYLTAAGVGVVVLCVAGFLLFLFTRGEHWVGARLERVAGRVPLVDGAALRRFFEQVAARLRRSGSNVGSWSGPSCGPAPTGCSTPARWPCSSAPLATGPIPDGILVAYGLANVLAAIPITPGGLGVIEATLTSVLVGFGTPRGVATLGVIAYRLVNFWLPIPLGGLAYLSLQVNGGGSSLERRNRLRRGSWRKTKIGEMDRAPGSSSR